MILIGFHGRACARARLRQRSGRRAERGCWTGRPAPLLLRSCL